MKISTRYISFLGILLFIIIISKTDIHEIYKILTNSRPEYILLALITIPAMVAFKGLRWKKIIDTIGLKYTLKESFKVSMIGTFVGTLTPGKSGDLIRTLYLQDKNPSSKSLSTIIIDRIFDVVSLVFLGGIGIIIMSYYFNQPMYSLYPVIIIPFGAIAIMTNKKLSGAITRRLFRQFVPEHKKAYVTECFNEFYVSLQAITRKKKDTALLCIITMIIWIIGTIQTYLIICALNINISIIYVFAFTPIITLINIIPVSISGIGTRDISLIFFFSLIDIPYTYALSTSLLALLMLWTELSMGAILWVLNPRDIKLRP